VAEVGQVELAVVEMVDDAAGRADEHVDAVAQRALLRRVGRASGEGVHLHAVRAAQHGDDLADLLRELARRSQHEHTWPAPTLGPLLPLLLRELLHQR